MAFIRPAEHRQEDTERIGVLLVNSGTPDSLAVGDVRRFLKGLLSDPRVVELPRLLWLPILHGIVLPTRPRRSAQKYRKIWTEQGSPLLAISKALRAHLSDELGRSVFAPLSIELGMLYAQPTVEQALTRLREAGTHRLLILPLFPQYCGSSTGAVYDQVNAELKRWRCLPELRFVADYHDHPGYIDALRASVDQHWRAHGRTKHLVISFHGIPERYRQEGDPYYRKCQETARLLAERLALRDGEWTVSFQSRFGAAEWLKPYTIELMAELPRRGIDEVTVICPGFAVDCLETLEEIEVENQDAFRAAGGRRFLYVPALNARPEHVGFLAGLIRRHCQGWTEVTPATASEAVRSVAP